MPDYRKKKVRHFGAKGKRQQNNDIPMKSAEKKIAPSRQNEMKVIKGKKLENRRRFRVVLASALVLSVVMVVLSFFLPVGLGENISNILSLAGSGKYPYEIYGAEILDTASRGNYYYVLTDTNIIASSNNGHVIYNDPHGFSSPSLVTSETRALLFDQGGTNLTVSSLKEEKNTITVDGSIITAAICRSGAFAVAFESDNYSATVSVYDKKGNRLYEWNSAKDIINNVALSPSGKELVVSTLGVEDGQYESNVYVFEYDSADPVSSKRFSDDVVLAIDSSYRKGFALLTNSNYQFINWSDYKASVMDNELEPAMYRKGRGASLVVYNRSGDRGDNSILVLSKKGEKISEIDFDGIISDIAFAHGHIYCISDTNVYMLDKQGKVLRKATCSYGSTRLAVTGTYSVATITSGEVESIKLEQESE